MQFYLRYFTFFKLNFSTSLSAFQQELAIKYNYKQENSLNIINSLAIKYFKSLELEFSNSFNSSKKHSR